MKKLTGSMFPAVQLIAIAALATMLTGCNTVSEQQSAEMRETAIAYYNQPKVAQLWVIENTNGAQVCEFTVKNFTRFEMNTPVPPVSVIPKDPTVVASIIDGIKSVAPWLMMGWMVHDSGGLGKSSSSSVTTTGTP